MSYDLRLGVRVENDDDREIYAVIDEPEYSSPTYNLGSLFRACTGWDFNQGEWYKVSEVLPLIEHGIHELKFNSGAYRKLEPENGWGNAESALNALNSLLECISKNTGSGDTWNTIPLDALYVSW